MSTKHKDRPAVQEEIITYLEMTSPDDLIWPTRAAPAFDFQAMAPADPVLHRRLYEQVGAPWQWTDRLPWSAADWQAHTGQDGIAVWVARVAGEPIGFVELDFREPGAVELVYFGLMPDWIGRGYGGAVLASGLDQAWRDDNTQRVWVHTCNFDHPNALANYQARGFRVTHVERQPIPAVDDATPGQSRAD